MKTHSKVFTLEGKYDWVYVTDSLGQLVPKWVQEIIAIIQFWFEKAQDGTHVLTVADPFSKVTLEEAEKMVKTIDNDIEMHESWRISGWDDTRPEASTELKRLSNSAKIVLCTQVKDRLKYQVGHPEEYIK